MLLKRLNIVVVIASQVLNFVVILYCATLLADFVWWVLTPAKGDIYVEQVDANHFNNSVKYIVNRYPFGVITTVESTTSLPEAMNSVKLIGVYFNPPKDSMAFVEYQNSIHNTGNNHGVTVGPKTAVVVRAGEAIVSGVVVRAIDLDSIVIAQGDKTGILQISGESVSLASSNLPPGSRVNDMLSRYKQLPSQQRQEIKELLANNPNKNQSTNTSPKGLSVQQRSALKQRQQMVQRLANQALGTSGGNASH